MTNPNEFLQFAKDLGLDRSASSVNVGPSSSASPSGLMVLNNICHLIEQLHALKLENQRLRAQLDLVEHLEKYFSKISSQDKLHRPLTTDDDEMRSLPLSRTNSLKLRCFPSRKDRSNSPLTQRMNSTSLDRDGRNSPNPIDSDSGCFGSTRFRQTLHSSFKQQKVSSSSSSFNQFDRPIPAISISFESEDEPAIKQKTNDEFDHVSSIKLDQENNSTNDDEFEFKRKPSKIARYRLKLQTKLDTVKRQLTETNSSINRDVLSMKLAPAMTKSYQEKMRQWASLQKSNFLVNYRRQSIETDRKFSSKLRQMKIESNIDTFRLSPIVSGRQRSLIVEQWRQIVTEEISLRQNLTVLDKKLIELKQIQDDVKQLKMQIFSWKSETTLIERNLPLIRFYSLDSFSPMKSSWIFAVQSAAYSDILDGAASKNSFETNFIKRNFDEKLKKLTRKRVLFQEKLLDEFSTINQKRKNSLIKNIQPDVFLNQRVQLEPKPMKTTKTMRRSRFDLKKTLQRSKTICASHIHSWFHRRRADDQSDQDNQRQQSTSIDSKQIGSFDFPIVQPSNNQVVCSSPTDDDSDQQFDQEELPVRIYFQGETSPHLRRIDLPQRVSIPTPPMSKLASPIVSRRNIQS